MNMNYKPFDLEAAKIGDPIITRSGNKARFVAHVPDAYETSRVVVVLGGCIASYSEDGRYYNETETDNDLFMAPRKRTVWVNLYGGDIRDAYWYNSEKEADSGASHHGRIGNRAYPLEIEE